MFMVLETIRLFHVSWLHSNNICTIANIGSWAVDKSAYL